MTVYDMSDECNQVWVYWVDKQHSHRPPYIERCLESIYVNSECDVRLCGLADAFALLPELPPQFEQLIPAHQSDVFRTGVLSRYGGMYIDADTFVLKSLRPLFGLLDDYEYVGMDWRPRARSEKEWSPIGIGILGPCRPRLTFMTQAFERQMLKLWDAGPRLNGSKIETSWFLKMLSRLRRAHPRSGYPFAWEELLSDILVPSFVECPPRAHMFDGAETWGALVGGPRWQGGNLGNPMNSMSQIGHVLPDTELLTISNSLLPRSVRKSSIVELEKHETILAHLLRATRHT